MGMAKELGGFLLDPRGRMSRQDLLVAATLMLMLDLLLASLAGGFALYAVKALAYWIGIVGVIKRLHDVGQSGWWVLGGAAAICIWSAVIGIGMVALLGLGSLHPGETGYIVTLGLLMLPPLGMTLWLHLAEGETGMNRFGPEPEGVSKWFARAGMADDGAASRR